jgi:hypothetical protein
MKSDFGADEITPLATNPLFLLKSAPWRGWIPDT